MANRPAVRALLSTILEDFPGEPSPFDARYAGQIAERLAASLELVELGCGKCPLSELVETACSCWRSAKARWERALRHDPDGGARGFAREAHRVHRQPPPEMGPVLERRDALFRFCIGDKGRLLLETPEELLPSLSRVWSRSIPTLRDQRRRVEGTAKSLEERLFQDFKSGRVLPQPAFHISLLPAFSVERPSAHNPSRLELRVSTRFDDRAIWFNDEKLELQRRWRHRFNGRLLEAQRLVEIFLHDPRYRSLNYSGGLLSLHPRKSLGVEPREVELIADGEFLPMRWASGGAVVVLELGRQAYFWTAFRDIDPVGLNIANGASETVEEQVNPDLLIGRELSEEVLVVSEHVNAGARVHRLEFGQCVRTEHMKPLVCITLNQAYERRWKWKEGVNSMLTLRGPHTVEVEYEDLDRSVGDGKIHAKTTHVYFTINLPELGIEVIRFYYLASLPPRGRFKLRDGELAGRFGGDRIARPIYLLPVDHLFRLWARNGYRMPVELDDDVWRAVNKDHADVANDRLLRKDARYREFLASRQRVLCPVTRQALDLFFHSDGYAQLCGLRTLRTF